jgi:hypothetical protein
MNVIDNTNAHRILKSKKPAQIMDEAHAYNMKKMAEYRAVGNAKK